MLLTGRIYARDVQRCVLSGRALPSVLELAHPVLEYLKLPPLQAAKLDSTLPASAVTYEFSARRDDRGGKALIESWGKTDWHGSGVICLRRLEGQDVLGCRYDQPYFVGSVAGRPVCCARLTLDRRDCRTRILELQSLRPEMTELMIEAVVHEIASNAQSGPMTVVIDIRADIPQLQASLEGLGFFPTAYYPALVASGSERVDAVQYTRLLNLTFADSLKMVRDLDWPPAMELLSQVTRSAQGAPPSILSGEERKVSTE